MIQLISPLWSFDDDMGRALLKRVARKYSTFIVGIVPVLMNMIAQLMGDVATVIGNRLTIETHQHGFKTHSPHALPSPVHNLSPLGTCFTRLRDERMLNALYSSAGAPPILI